MDKSNSLCGFLTDEDEQNKNHVYSLSTHVQMIYLSHQLQFTTLNLLHVSSGPDPTFPILQIPKLLYKPVRQ